MRSITFAAVLAAAALAPAVAIAVADDRPPTAEERAAIESTLSGAGFSGWKEIEFDDGKWEVDDARHSDGKTYDVELSEKSLEILTKKIDD